MKYRFFHWSCDTCGAFGGAQLSDDLSAEDLQQRLQSAHDHSLEDEEHPNCTGTVEQVDF